MPREVEITLPTDGSVVENPTTPVPDEPEIQVYRPGDEVPPDPAPAKTEAELQVEKLQAELEAQRTQSTTLETGFGALAETLKELKTQPTSVPTAPAAPAFDAEKFNEQLKEKGFENPLEAQLMGINTFVTPQIKTLEDKMKEIDYKTEKLSFASNPKYSEIFSEYGGEVEAVATQLGRGPGAVEKAVAIVQGNHLDEIAAKRVDAILEKKLAEIQAAQKPVTAPSYTGITHTPAPASRGVTHKVVLTEADEAAIASSMLTEKAWIARELKNGRWK